MDKINPIKSTILTALGVVGSTIATLLGGWNTALQTLIVCMGIDYLTGLIVAGVFKRSGKTENGALESRAGWKGLCRKGATLLMVLIAARLDLLTGSDFIRTMVVIAYIANECLSITENFGLMGVPIPAPIVKAIEMLKDQSEGEEE